VTSPAGPVETGVLPAGHRFAQIGSGSRVVLSIPGLMMEPGPMTPKAAARSWKRWLPAIERHDLTFVDVGRRPDLPPGSTAEDVADDYAAVIHDRWGGAVGVMGISTGGAYAQSLAIRHPDLVERLLLGFTAHRNTDATKVRERRAVEHFKAGRWRSGWGEFGPWFLPGHPRIGSALTWLAGPSIGGRPSDLRALLIDAHVDDTYDVTDQLGEIRCRTLVVSGARDAAYPPYLVRTMVEALPDARHIEYPKAGHMGPGPVFAEDACAFFAAGVDPPS
jgi:pimeloyl-ACP methyl ester carboxylesterase